MMDLQELINTGTAWHLEGGIGREAMRAIESGECILGEVGHRDYWGCLLYTSPSPRDS